MNNELNVKIEEMMADFNAKNEALMSRIENLKKSEDSIKDSFWTQFLEIKQVMKDSFLTCEKLLTDLFISKPKYIKYENRNTNWDVNCVKSLKSGKDYYGSYYINSYITCSENSIEFRIAHSSDSVPRNCSHGWYYFGDKDSIEEAQTLAEWYLSGKFNNSLLWLVQQGISNYLKCQENEVSRIESVIENSQPLAKTETHWSDYIMYLLKWSSEHADKEFAGMSPACYDEWLDNEQGE